MKSMLLHLPMSIEIEQFTGLYAHSGRMLCWLYGQYALEWNMNSRAYAPMNGGMD